MKKENLYSEMKLVDLHHKGIEAEKDNGLERIILLHCGHMFHRSCV